MVDQLKSEHPSVGTVIDEGLNKAAEFTSAVQQKGEQVQARASEALSHAGTMIRTAGEQARSVAEDASTAAQDLARKARDQAVAAGDTLCKQGTQASDYLAARVSEYPLTAVIIAGAVGYGLALMMRNRETAH
jgi:ElaB/YqjD/DUF883 family membrane-anchored ribosome-binding protein